MLADGTYKFILAVYTTIWALFVFVCNLCVLLLASICLQKGTINVMCSAISHWQLYGQVNIELHCS